MALAIGLAAVNIMILVKLHRQFNFTLFVNLVINGDSMLDSGTLDKFKNPGAELRGKPFWSWNGKLDKAELLRQIEVMKDMGFGGFFMHSRSGLETEYLGREWFDLINACADEAGKFGMEAWLYDEDRWPSGSVGGLATKESKYRMKYLRCSVYKAGEYKWDNDAVAVFTCELDGLSYTDCRRAKSGDEIKAAKAGSVLAFTIEEMKCGSFYNGQTYLDTMNAEAVEHFVELTHEKYREHCGDKFGKSIKGMFTDEPHRGMIMSRVYDGHDPEWVVPYTPGFFDKFQEAFGYDLVENLPELFLWKDGHKVSQVKWHYVEMTERLFLDNFARITHKWCRDNDLLLTGHILHEDTLSAQTIPCGSVMRYYEYMDCPGVDVLTETNRNYWIVKQLTSAARQLGKTWLLSELYGCSGWQMTLQNYKETGDWQSLFGINLRCPHLSWYTMKGQAKRDYPASILHQSGWYKEFEAVETYYSRLQLMLMQGEAACEVLIVNPVESAWCQIYPGWCEGFKGVDKDIQNLEMANANLFLWLSGAQIDFDYGDEDMMTRLASVEKCGGRAVLKVGKASYTTVVVPPMTTIRSTTLDLLTKFRAAGGNVIFAGEPAFYVDATASAKAAILASNCITTEFEKTALTAYIKESADNFVEVIDSRSGNSVDEIFCQVRCCDDAVVLVAMNVSTKNSYKGVKIRIKGSGQPQIWDCRSGKRYAVEFEKNGEFLEVVTDFDPAREFVLVVSSKTDAGLKVKKVCSCGAKQAVSGEFEYSLSEPNICVLDAARFKIANNEWQPRTEVLRIDRQIRQHLGLEKRGGQMVQPWCRGKATGNNADVALEFGFNIKDMPKKDIVMVVEEPEKFKIFVNDKPLPQIKLPDFWLDICFSKLIVPCGLLREGKNTIRLETCYDNDGNIETVYLLGDFGVETDGIESTLTTLPKKLTIGDITPQGLPFYSGNVRYKLDGAALKGLTSESCIEMTNISASCVKLVDGKGNEKLMVFKPYICCMKGLDISSGLSIELVMTRRNTFGPLHLDRPDGDDFLGFRKWYGPDEFETQGSLWCDKYNLIPQGLLSEPIINN